MIDSPFSLQRGDSDTSAVWMSAWATPSRRRAATTRVTASSSPRESGGCSPRLRDGPEPEARAIRRHVGAARADHGQAARVRLGIGGLPDGAARLEDAGERGDGQGGDGEDGDSNDSHRCAPSVGYSTDTSPR